MTIEDLNKAISLDPKFVAAYAHRGLVYAESGEQEKALADFNRDAGTRSQQYGNLYEKGVFFMPMHNVLTTL